MRQPDGGQRRRHRPDEKVRGRDLARAGAVAVDEGRAEGDRHQRDLGCRIGIGERAADRPARPRRGMADPGHDRGQHGHLGRDDRVALDIALPRGCTDLDRLAGVAHIGECGNPRDIDEPRRPGEPHRHQWDQRLPAGNEPRAILGREQCAGFVNAGGARVFERGRLHFTHIRG